MIARKIPTDLPDLYREARALLADKKHWCRQSFAVDALGDEVYPNANDVDAVCMLGALMRALDIGEEEDGGCLFRSAITGLELHLTGDDESVADWNDAPETTHADVLTMLDRAIAEAEDGNPS